MKKKPKQKLQKRRFPAYFRHFRPENIFFKNQAPSQFKHYHFASVCKISWKNIQYSLRFKKYCFSGENWLFRRFLDSSGFKNQSFWQLWHAWWRVLLLIMLLCEKITKYEEKTQTKYAKTAISGIFPTF